MKSRNAHPKSWRLYVILDRAMVSSDSRLIRIAKEAIRGGADALQLRYKGAKILNMIRLGRRLKDICKRAGVPLLINDRIEAALAIGADGLHISKSDMSWALARRLLGKNKILGVSASRIDDVRKAEDVGCDYVGCGPVFRTPIKNKKKPLKSELINKLMKFDIPIIFIGGINLKNAGPLAEKSHPRIAVIRAVVSSRSPYKAARTLKGIMTR